MPSVKSYFNPGLYRKNIKRFWPIWGLYFLIWFLMLPLRNLVNRSYPMNGRDLMSTLYSVGPLLALFFAPAVAMALFSYLCKGRAANFMSALPLRREGLFLTNYLSGLTFLVGSNLVICLLTAVTQAMTVGGEPAVAFIWFAVQSLLCLFFYSFAVFCAMFTGSLAALPIFYGILNVLFPSLYQVINYMLRQYLFGFTGWTEQWTDWFWPIAKLIMVLQWEIDADALSAQGWGVLLIYAVVGLALAAAALLIYRRRHMERAGDVISVYPVRPLFKYGLAFSSAVLIGSLLFNLHTDGWGGSGGGWALTIYMLLSGIFGYFVGEMLLRKSFRVWKRSWRGGAAFTLVLILVCAAVELDLTGFERRVPDNTASVIVSNIFSYPEDGGQFPTIRFTDPAEIELVRAIHRAVVAERGQYSGHGLMLHYTLDNGNTVLRRYDGRSWEHEDDEMTAQIEALLNTKTARMAAYYPIGDGARRPNSAQIIVSNVWGDVFSTAETTKLYEAVCRDLEAGRIGRRFAAKTPAYSAAGTDTAITFFFRDTMPQTTADGKPQVYHSDGASVAITVQSTATETIRVLNELGITPSQGTAIGGR